MPSRQWPSSGGRARRLQAGRSSPSLAAAFAAGTLVALPQIVEFLRILPFSYRGYQGYSEKVATISSLDPRQLAEWLIPFLFGRPDVIDRGTFWGAQFYTGFAPVLLLPLSGPADLRADRRRGRQRGSRLGRVGIWAWGWIAFGVFFSLGRFNPVAAWLLSWQKSLRYPNQVLAPRRGGRVAPLRPGFRPAAGRRPRGRGGRRGGG